MAMQKIKLKKEMVKIMKNITIVLILIMSLTFAGCAGMSQTEQRTLSGAGIGAAGGAVIGAMSGNVGLGTAIGAAVGGSGGYLYGKHKESEEEAYQRGYQQGKKSQ
jgi:osmotically inducible lipoprotein OsmB